MLVSIDWIKDYVKLDKWPQDKEFCDRMIMSGSHTLVRVLKMSRLLRF